MPTRGFFIFFSAFLCTNAIGQTSLWTTSATPGLPELTTDTRSVTVGVKFYSDVPGSVIGVRFYKGPDNLGTHVGALWSGSGAQLATITFTGETLSGWQQANFSTPVSIAANTTYVISYLAPKGEYARDRSYPWATLSATPLHAYGSSPGVYIYDKSIQFPTKSSAGSNYWVDLVFVPTTNVFNTYTISGTVTGSPARLTLSGTAGASTATDSNGAYQFIGLNDGAYVVAPSETGYTFTPSTASVTIQDGNVRSVNFAATPVAASHSVSLSWIASTSTDVVGYNVYRGTASGGPYTRLTSTPTMNTSYSDNNVVAGQTYYYVASSVDGSASESVYSNEASAAVLN